MTSGSASWGVLLSKHQRQKLVEEELTTAGVETFIPLIEDTRIIRGRHIQSFRPLLGRYILFVIRAGWESLGSFRGVDGIMMTIDGTPATVRDQSLDALRLDCINRVYRPKVVQSRNGFQYGQRVTPREGPMQYHVGFFEGSAKSGRKEFALFKLFGREQKLTFKSGDLIAA